VPIKEEEKEEEEEEEEAELACVHNRGGKCLQLGTD
jgi:hypothetical protein